MALFLHELVHVLLGLLIGYLVWKRGKKLFISFFAAFLGSVLVDLDHLFDYFVAFGLNFNLEYFLNGYAFLVNDKLFVPLHAWELVLLLLIIFKILEKKPKKTLILKYALSFLLAFSLALYSHLIVDTISNNLVLQGYSLIYRAWNNFEISSFSRFQ